MDKDIENLKNILVDLEDAENGAIINLSQEEIDSLKTILNLTENQQKEIKKEKSRIMELAELLDKQENEIKSLEQELEIQEGCSISKDKIRERIKELEEQKEKLKYDGDRCFADYEQFCKKLKFFKEQIGDLLEEN